MSKTREESSREVPLLDKSERELERFSEERGLSLSGEDLVSIRSHYEELGRNPTRLEVEVLAQTWSEHCKHRIFHALLEHERDGETEEIDGIFETYVRSVTEKVREEKPGFVLAAFDDNAGFVSLGDQTAACMKLETHNHPSAIEPYAGSNTGLGGVIRDILGAGLGSRPIGSLDVFCLGDPELEKDELPEGVIHPLGIFRGVVRGVRDYGNRMGIPTVAGAIQFARDYTYNPLVFCGTVGLIPTDDIEKEVRPGQVILTAGGLTGRDGLHGATFSSDTLSHESHEEDQGSVQIGNPIEEKKVADFILEARQRGLIEYITDCGAGGYSSAVGEMVEDTGGEVQLENVPLKEEGMDPWEIFLSESQERMVLNVDPSDLDEIQELAEHHETRCVPIGRVTDTGKLKVEYEGELLCDLDCDFMHSPPRLEINSKYVPQSTTEIKSDDHPPIENSLRELLQNINIASRAPVIREYDHEVQGNTVLKPLAGRTGDSPEDGVVLDVEEMDGAIAVGLALLPEYGRIDPHSMGRATVDETVRQLVSAGADPEEIALLDNFSMGNPEIPERLGELVEAARGMAQIAEAYQCPFISGKDSFYNSFDTQSGETISVPMTLVVSGLGVVENLDHVTGSSFVSEGNLIYLLGETRSEMGGSVYSQTLDRSGEIVPQVEEGRFRTRYETLHDATKAGLVESVHDLSEGGLGVALSEMSFSEQADVEVNLHRVDRTEDMHPAEILFSESAGRFLVEIDPENKDQFLEVMGDVRGNFIGETSGAGNDLTIRNGDEEIVNVPISELKTLWTDGLTPYY